jgi:hypothetical protein
MLLNRARRQKHPFFLLIENPLSSSITNGVFSRKTI